MKKRTAIILTGLLTLSMIFSLTGCGIPFLSKGDTSGNEEEETEDEEDTEEVGSSEETTEETDADQDDADESAEEDEAQDEDEDDDDDDSSSGSKFGKSSKGGSGKTWQEMYLSEVNNDDARDSEYTYALIYVDDDDIPELVIDTGFEAGGCRICTYHDGEMDVLQTSRLYFTYVERKNELDNEDGHMGYYYDYVYTIKNGKWKCVFEGEYSGFTDEIDVDYDDETGRYKCTDYLVNGEETDEEGYMKALKKVYKLSKAAPPQTYYLYDDLYSYLTEGKLLCDTHSYELFVDDCSWEDAVRKCEQKGGYLASLTSDEEFEIVEKMIRKEDLTNVVFYVGAEYSNYQWQWTEPGLTQRTCVNQAYYKYWLNSGPSYKDKLPDGREIDETCVELLYRKSDDAFYLNDVVDDVVYFYPSFKGKMGYICEYSD